MKRTSINKAKEEIRARNKSLKREKISVLARRFRYIMYKLGRITRNDLKCCSLKTTEKQVKSYRAFMSEGLGHRRSIFSAVKFSVNQSEVESDEQIEYAVNSGLRIIF